MVSSGAPLAGVTSLLWREFGRNAQSPRTKCTFSAQLGVGLMNLTNMQTEISTFESGFDIGIHALCCSAKMAQVCRNGARQCQKRPTRMIGCGLSDSRNSYMARYFRALRSRILDGEGNSRPFSMKSARQKQDATILTSISSKALDKRSLPDRCHPAYRPFPREGGRRSDIKLQTSALRHACPVSTNGKPSGCPSDIAIGR